MRHEARALIFDLDDTLYPLEDFVRSGFAAVARRLEDVWQIDRREALAFIMQAASGSARGRELQACATHFDLPHAIVPELVDVIRNHVPSIALPVGSRVVLEAVRPDWRLGIVTNGMPDLQARKVRALGIEPLVDCIVYANAVGDGRGKPGREPFLAAADHLGVRLERAVFVGNDEVCDVFGARRAGMSTIHLAPGSVIASRCGHVADATAGSLAEVPALAAQLVTGDSWSAYVA
jgi:putative hydrolase of the HAD superfamily